MRLIDAERLKADVFKASMDEHFMPMKLLDCDTVTEMIDTALTIEERKTGKWIIDNRYSGIARCSECGMRKDIINLTRYCEDCGAKMEVDE